jgi:hypothetical protein
LNNSGGGVDSGRQRQREKERTSFGETIYFSLLSSLMKRKNEDEAMSLPFSFFFFFFSLVRHCRIELINNGDQPRQNKEE